MQIAKAVRKAAIGPAPYNFGRNPLVADWVGAELQYDVLEFKDMFAEPYFYQCDEDTQRTFLLLASHAMEAKK